MRRLALTVTLLFGALACRSDDAASVAAPAHDAGLAAAPRRELRIATAQDLTRLYAASALSDWRLQASAAGADCAVLFVQTPVVMERTMVDAMHYGHGSYRISDTNIDELYRTRGFRGVLYKDGSARLWVYGQVVEGAPAPCR